MITIQCEFKTRTILGYSDCKAEKVIYTNPRDIAHVEEAVEWCKKAFHSESVNDPMITFVYDDGTPYGVSTGRVFRLCGRNSIVTWQFPNGAEKVEDVKVTAKTFRELYLDCADRFIKEQGEGA